MCFSGANYYFDIFKLTKTREILTGNEEISVSNKAFISYTGYTSRSGYRCFLQKYFWRKNIRNNVFLLKEVLEHLEMSKARNFFYNEMKSVLMLLKNLPRDWIFSLKHLTFCRFRKRMNRCPNVVTFCFILIW